MRIPEVPASDGTMSKNPPKPRPHEYAISIGPIEWARLLSRAIVITASLAGKATKALVSPSSRHGRSWYEYVAYEGMGDYQCGLSAVRIQNLLPGTSKKCQRYAEQHKLAFSEIPLSLDQDTIALWLGPRKPSKLTVLFHGGGYACPALGEQINMAYGFDPKSPSRADTALVVLQYALASEDANHYPYQLQQAASLMQHLLEAERIAPSDITLVGDSAGGHLLLGLLLHIHHPNPKVPRVRLPVDQKFNGAALISPRVHLESSLIHEQQASPDASASASTSQPKPTKAEEEENPDPVETLRKKDVIRPASLRYWASNFLGGAPQDPWNNVLSALAEWWADLPVEDILVTYGECELYRHDIAELCEVIGSSSFPGRVESVEGPGELHEHMIMNRFLGINKECVTERAFVEWLVRR